MVVQIFGSIPDTTLKPLTTYIIKYKIIKMEMNTMKDTKDFDWTINVFEYVLGYSADEWKELNEYINNRGDNDEN